MPRPQQLDRHLRGRAPNWLEFITHRIHGNGWYGMGKCCWTQVEFGSFIPLIQTWVQQHFPIPYHPWEWHIYLLWMVDLYGFHVGKYTIVPWILWVIILRKEFFQPWKFQPMDTLKNTQKMLGFSLNWYFKIWLFWGYPPLISCFEFW